MDDRRLLALLEKYKLGKCTPDELRELDDWYTNLDASVNDIGKPDEVLLLEDFKSRLHTASETREIKQYWLKPLLRYAAVVIGIGVCVGLWHQLQRPAKVYQQQGTIAFKGLTKNKIVILPDGSTVVLKEGSSLDYRQSFDAGRREVTLVGEAYFDIIKDSERPFVVHTGKLKTLVLGTAFNIKAYPKQQEVVVTVTRGKVQVREEQKVLAVLTPNKQISYEIGTSKARSEVVDAKENIAWTREMIKYEAASFRTIADELSKIHHVRISFEDDALGDCPITASFISTADLTEMIEVLCKARGASYSIQGSEILIKGEGCK